MNSNTKTIMAILAVAMMVGVALVPFTYEPTEAAEKTTASEKSVTFEEILTALNNLGDEKTFSNAGFSLVPVNDTENYDPIDDLPEPISTAYTVGSGESLELTGSHTFSNVGKIVVEDGGKIIMCNVPDDGSDNNFTLINNNSASISDVITVKSGATISICGVDFKMFCGGDAEMSVIRLTKSATVNFYSVKTSGVYKLGYDVPDRVGWTRMTLFEMLDQFKGTSFELKGTYNKTTSGDAFTVSFTDMITNIKMVDGRFSYELKAGLDGSSTRSSCSIMVTPRSSDAGYGYDAVVGADIKLDTFAFRFTEKKSTETVDRYTMDNMYLNFSGLKITADNTIGTGSVTSVYSIGWDTGSTKKFTFGADNLKIHVPTNVIDVVIEFDEPKMTVDNLSANFTEVSTTVAKKPVKTITAMSSTANLNIVCKSIHSDTSIIFLELTLAEIDDVELSINTLKTEFDSTTKTFNTTTASFGITGTVVPTLELFNYSLTLTTSITDLLFAVNAETMGYNLTFSATNDVAVKYNGTDKHLTVGITTFSTDGSEHKISKLSVSNDIPFSMIFGTEQDMIGYADLNNVVFTIGDDITITGSSFDVQCNTIVDGICDVVGLKTDSAFTIQVIIPESDSEAVFLLSSTSFTGFLKNVGADKEAFSITGSTTVPASVKFIPWPYEPIYGNQMEIVSGTATFGAGLLPFTLVVDSGVKFSANGLSANSFVFESGSTLSGNVIIDLADKENRSVREITIGDRTVQMAVAKDKGGYVLSLNLADEKATITTHTGWTLLDDSQYTKTDDTHATFSFANKNFNGITNSDFYFSYQGESKTKQKCGDVVTLKDLEQKTGMEPIGWNDGNKTYAAGTNYVMPARTVVMTPVYAEKPEITPISEGVIAVVAENPESTAVAVSVEALEDVTEVTFVVGGSSVTLDETTIEAIKDSKPTSSTIAITAEAIKEVKDETQKKVVGDNYAFDVGLFIDGERFSDFTDGMEFQVTLNIVTDKDVEGFKVHYMDDNGHLTEMTEVVWEKCDDGTYNVTFTTSHFSNFVAEPLTKDVPPGPTPVKDETIKAFVVLAVVTAVLCLIYMAFFCMQKDKH